MWVVNDPRVSGKDTVDICKVFVEVCFDTSCYDRACNIRTATREGTNLIVNGHSEKSRNDKHIIVLTQVFQFIIAARENAGIARLARDDDTCFFRVNVLSRHVILAEKFSNQLGIVVLASC